MKKNNRNRLVLSILFSLSVFGACTNEIKKKTSLEYDGLKGQVKSVQTKGYSVVTGSLGQIAKGEIIAVEWGFNNTFIKYDEKGNWTEYSSYEPDSSIIRKEIPEYDGKGDAIAQYVYNKGIFNHKIVFKNDNKGNIIESLQYAAYTDSLVSKSVYKYDDKGNEIEAYEYTSTDSLTDKIIRKYDDKGNNIEMYNYNVDNKLNSKIITGYDENGQRIERIEYDADSNMISKTIYKYNEKGFYTDVCVYDANNSLKSKKTYIYKYDSVGNWIEEIVYDDGVATKIIERQIDYK
jgi:YD repeat-containing protein